MELVCVLQKKSINFSSIDEFTNKENANKVAWFKILLLFVAAVLLSYEIQQIIQASFKLKCTQNYQC